MDENYLSALGGVGGHTAMARLDPELVQKYRTRDRDEVEVAREISHAKVESSLLLDPYLLDGLDDLSIHVALMAPFHVRGRGNLVYPGPGYAIRYWGVPEGSFTRRNTDVRAHPNEDEWRAMYAGIYERQMGESEGPRGHIGERCRLLRAPSIGIERRHRVYRRSGQPRTVALLQRNRIPNTMLPSSLGGRGTPIRGLRASEVRILFALYALAGSGYGGVDPNHLCVRGAELVVSPDLQYRLRSSADDLLPLLVQWDETGLIAFIPAELRDVQLYPSARSHVAYWADSADPLCTGFVLRPLRGVQQQEDR